MDFCSNRTTAHGRRRDTLRGSILIVVLVTLLITGVALTLFIEKASDDLLVETREIDSKRLRMEAYSALETTLSVLNEFRQVNGGLRSPGEGWSDPLGWAGYEPGEGRSVQVEFSDESGKLSLPKASTSSLVDLFKSWEIQQADAERLADALLEWSKADYVPASGYSNTYDLDKIPFGAPCRSPRSFSELAAIDVVRSFFFDDKGRPNIFHKRFVDSVSLFDFSGVNVNAIRPGVLDAMGVDAEHQHQLSDFMEGKSTFKTQGGGYFKSVDEASGILGAQASGSIGLGVDIKALRIIITVREGQSFFRLNTVVTAAGGGGAKAITTKAAPKFDGARPNAEKLSKAKASEAAQTTAKTSKQSLNYPFAILEIRENDEQPQPAAEIPAIKSS